MDERVLGELLSCLAKARPEADAFVAESDEVKRRVLRELGFHAGSAHDLKLPGETVRLRRFSRG